MKLPALVFTILLFSVSTQGNDLPLQMNQFEDRVNAYLENPAAELDLSLVEELRANGYKSLEWLVNCYQQNIPQNYDSYQKSARFNRLYDKVSGQKDGIYAQLFWHQDLETAKKEATRTNKQLISLRMLGDFSEDLSCANSRFFRTVLYSDSRIASFLKRYFVLHVESVIDVPKITIEYPDGTVQRQTITGNSLHLMMKPSGEVVDVLPGLYGPDFFMKWLNKHSSQNFNYKHHAQWLNKLVDNDVEYLFVNDHLEKVADQLPTAFDAMQMAVGKAIVERPILKQLDKNKTPLSPDQKLEQGWLNTLDLMGFKSEKLSSGSRLLIHCKKQYTPENSLEKTVTKIEEILTLENLRNELNLRRRALLLLEDENLKMDDQFLVSTIYKELFLTPLDDKKMGMYQPDSFYGLTDDGF